jgi:anti-anti-sigma factor
LPVGPELEIEKFTEDGVLVLRPVGWITARQRDALTAALVEEFEARRARVVVDLSHLQLITASELAVFAYYQHLFREHGGCLVLACPAGKVLRMLRLADLERALPIENTLEDAIRAARAVEFAG